MIDNILWPIDHDELRRIPVRALSGRDTLIWHDSSNGMYSVRTGYHVAMRTGEESSRGTVGGNTSLFRKLWNLSIIPSRLQLASRGSVFYGFMELVVLNGTKEDHGIFAMVSWSLWLDRNKLALEGRSISPSLVVSRASSLWSQFLSCNALIPNSPDSARSSRSWCKPPLGTVKINTDATVIEGSRHCGIGVFARDDQGIVLKALATRFLGVCTPFVAELFAVGEGILMVIQNHWPRVIFESDALNVVSSISSPYYFAAEEPIVSFIITQCSQAPDWNVRFCRREANQVAHNLASYGFSITAPRQFDVFCPIFLITAVKYDLNVSNG